MASGSLQTFTELLNHGINFSGFTEEKGVIFGVQGDSTLLNKLNRFKVDKGKRLIYLLQKNGNDWVTLVGSHADGKELFIYQDCTGTSIKECFVNRETGIGIDVKKNGGESVSLTDFLMNNVEDEVEIKECV